MDKTTLGNSANLGIKTDTHLTALQYNWSVLRVSLPSSLGTFSRADARHPCAARPRPTYRLGTIFCRPSVPAFVSSRAWAELSRAPRHRVPRLRAAAELLPPAFPDREVDDSQRGSDLRRFPWTLILMQTLAPSLARPDLCLVGVPCQSTYSTLHRERILSDQGSLRSARACSVLVLRRALRLPPWPRHLRGSHHRRVPHRDFQLLHGPSVSLWWSCAGSSPSADRVAPPLPSPHLLQHAEASRRVSYWFLCNGMVDLLSTARLMF